MVLPKPNEDTITTILNQALSHLRVKSMTFPSLSTPVGTRKPDIYCQNGGNYVIEAKFTGRELTQAIGKIQNDYLKYSELLNLNGGFALLHPHDLAVHMSATQLENAIKTSQFQLVEMFPPNDGRNFNVFEGSFEEVVNEITKQVLTPPVVSQPNPKFLQLALRIAAEELADGLKGVKGKELENLFGGKNVFMSVLHYESEKEYPQQNMQVAAAFLLVNQLLFYQILASASTKLFPDLEEIDSEKIHTPRDLLPYFRKVTKRDYKAIFSYDIASHFNKKDIGKLKSTISVVQGITPQKIKSDLLGTIFHNLIPLKIRKEVAAYYTNIVAAELLANLVIVKAEATVADFACGSGGLLVGAYKRKRELIQSRRPFTAQDHTRFVEEEILGIDVMPFAANVAACHIALQAPQYFTNKVQVAVWDSTDLLPNSRIPSVADVDMVLTGQQNLDSFYSKQEMKGKVKAKKGVVKLAGKSEDVKLQEYDCIMMNPPFTRQEKIGTKRYKDELIDRFRTYSRFLDGQMGYYGYFIFQADKFLSINGSLAFVLPATVLRVRSTQGIRTFLSQNYVVEHIIASRNRSAFSENTFHREFLLVARKKGNGDISNLKTKVSIIKQMPTSSNEAEYVANQILSEDNIDEPELEVRTYPYEELVTNKSNWFMYIAVKNRELIELLNRFILKNKQLVPLSSVADTHRSDLDAFKISNFPAFIIKNRSSAEKAIDLWVLEKEGPTSITAVHKNIGKKVEIPKSSLQRGLRRMAYFNRINVSADADYLIVKSFRELEQMAGSIVPHKSLQSVRYGIPKWEKAFNEKKACVLFSRRFDISAPGTSNLAVYSENPIIGINFWGIHKKRTGQRSKAIWAEPTQIDKHYAKALTIWLNSTFGLLETLMLRAEARGAWMTVHDYLFDEIAVPNPSTSDTFQRQANVLFDQLESYAFPSILEQLTRNDPNRRKIDYICLDFLRFDGDKDQFLDKLYRMITDEINTLKDIMEETGEIDDGTVVE